MLQTLPSPVSALHYHQAPGPVYYQPVVFLPPSPSYFPKNVYAQHQPSKPHFDHQAFVPQTPTFQHAPIQTPNLNFNKVSVAPKETKRELKMFVSQSDNYSIIYPNWWTEIEPNVGQVLFISPRTSPNQFCENISVISEDLSSAPSLQLLSNYTMYTLSNMILEPGCHFLKSQNSRLAGHEAYEVIYSGMHDNIRLLFKQIWTVVNGKAYIISFTCEQSKFASLQRLADQLMNSFRVLPPSSE